MDPIIKEHLDAIAEYLKGTKNSFLFLMADDTGAQHIVKNCADHNAAALMVNYIDATPEVDTAFSNYVFNLLPENQQNSIQQQLEETMEKREDLTLKTESNG